MFRSGAPLRCMLTGFRPCIGAEHQTDAWFGLFSTDWDRRLVWVGFVWSVWAPIPKRFLKSSCRRQKLLLRARVRSESCDRSEKIVRE